MARWFLFLLSTLLAAQTRPIRILTYNIHHAEGADAAIDIARIAAVINSAGPDFAAIQEVDVRTARVAGADLAHDLARLTGLHCVFGKTINYQGGLYGNVILSRWPIHGFVNRELPSNPGREKRAVLAASTGDGFHFFAAHLDIAEPDRLLAAARLRQLVRESPAGWPMILAGDLNAPPGSPTMDALFEDWTSAALDQPLPTSPAAAPKRQIDYVLFRPANRWKVLDARVLEEAAASDHRPLLVTLELLPPGGPSPAAKPFKLRD